MITIRDGKFYAPQNAPYAAALKSAGWGLIRGEYTTNDPTRVVPVVQYIDPSLIPAMMANVAKFNQSVAKEASKDFVAIVPEGKKLFGFQEADVEYILTHKDTLLAEDAGLGKEQPVTEPVLTPKGFVPIGTLRVGDTVFGSDGHPCRVLNVYPQGVKKVYTIEFSDGSKVRAGEEHLWKCRDWKNEVGRFGKDYWRVLPTSVIKDMRAVEIPVVSPIQYEEQKLPIHPYVLGVLLGDGSLCGKTVQLTLHVMENDIAERVSALLPEGVTLSAPRVYGNTAQRYIVKKDNEAYRNPFKQLISALELNVHGAHKFVPEVYKQGSAQQRLELLRGLLDTDGSVSVKKHGVSIIFHSRNYKLCEDVQYLVRSLGGRASINKFERKDGRGVDIQVSVTLGAICPFYTRTKADKFYPQKPVRKYIKQITETGVEESVCIRVSSKDSTYITSDFIVTHNTAIMITALNHMKPKRVLIICPAIAKYNWMLKEWPKWNCLADLSIDVAEAQKAWPETDVIIVNYDILERFKKQIDDVEWDMLICDESHRIKNSEAKRTKLVLGGTLKTTKDKAIVMGAAPSRRRGFYKVQAIKAGKRVFATATPMNRPKDLWTVCEAFDPKGLGANWDYFHRRYCSMMKTPFGIDINGADNLEELGAKMRTAFMVRHVPSEVIDLPPLREELFVLPPVQLVKKEEDAFVDENMAALLAFASATGAEVPAADTRARKAELLGMVGAAIIGNVPQIGKPEFKPLFTEFAKLREQTGLAKVPSVIEYLSDKIDNENPIVIFAYHRSVIKLLLEAYPDAAYVMGGMPSRERAEQVSKFEDGKTNVFIGNLDAAGEAITLTRAAYIAFVEQDWRATAMIQARKRIHRITQDRPCLAEHLCAAESCDYYLATTMFGKMAHIQETLGSC